MVKAQIYIEIWIYYRIQDLGPRLFFLQQTYVYHNVSIGKLMFSFDKCSIDNLTLSTTILTHKSKKEKYEHSNIKH